MPFRRYVFSGPYEYPQPPSPTYLTFPNMGLYAGQAGRLLHLFTVAWTEWEAASDPAQWTWCCPSPLTYVPGVARVGVESDCWIDQQCAHAFLTAQYAAKWAKRGVPTIALDHWAELFCSLYLLQPAGFSLLPTDKVAVSMRGAQPLYQKPRFLEVRKGPNSHASWSFADEVTAPCFLHGNGAGKAIIARLDVKLRQRLSGNSCARHANALDTLPSRVRLGHLKS